MRLRFSHQGLDYARALAEHDSSPGKSKIKCADVVDAMFDSLSDDCPACGRNAGLRCLLRYNETMIEVREERVYWREATS